LYTILSVTLMMASPAMEAVMNVQLHRHDTYNHQETNTEFLGKLRGSFGPPRLFRQFFFLAEAEARARGVRLSFGTFDDLVETNRRNIETWSQLVRVFDSSIAPIPADRAFCILGRDSVGRIVATQAARVYDTSSSNLRDLMQGLQLFFPDTLTPEIAAREKCEVSAPSAAHLQGRIVYSGGGWYHPDYRGCQLSAILPRISRAYALARWNSDYTVTFVADALVARGVVARYGYTNIEWGVRSSANGRVYYEGHLAWMGRAQLISDLSRFVRAGGTQIDTIPHRRRA
jgi:hypothetical protein